MSEAIKRTASDYIAFSPKRQPASGPHSTYLTQLTHLTERATRAFTLIEMLVVVGIIAILAALIMPGMRIAKAAQMRSKARTQLNQIDTMIQSYKSRKNYYPPSAPGYTVTNALYYELSGTRLDTNNVFTTLDGNAQLPASQVQPIFGLGGFVNVTQGSGGDEGGGAQNFAKGLVPSEVVEVTNSVGQVFTLVSASVDGPDYGLKPRGGRVNPFCYNSVNPTNNPKSYDLWVDIVIGDKTNRICNWSDKAILLQ